MLPVRELYLCERVKESKPFLQPSTLLTRLGVPPSSVNLWACMHLQVSAYQESPHAESNELWPLAAAIKSKPLWFSIEPALPASFTSLYGRPHWVHKTGTPKAHWAASLPPTNRQPHKAVPHHQMWWSLFLILDRGPNSSADTVWNSHFTFKLGAGIVRWCKRGE